MSLTPRIIPNNWTSVQQAVAKLASLRLGVDSTPTFAGLLSGDLTLSKICTVAAGLNVLRVTGLQTDETALTGTLRGAYIDVSNGSTAATGTIRALELKARTEAPGDSGSNVAVLEGLSISADSKDHSVTTMRAAEFILDGKTGGTITEAVGLRIANNLQANKATTSYALQIYRDSFDYTADIQLSSGGTIGGSSGDMKIDSNGDVTLSGSRFQIYSDSTGSFIKQVGSGDFLTIGTVSPADDLIFISNDDIEFHASGDNNDFILFYTSGNIPYIHTQGADLRITSATGEIGFDTCNLTTEGIVEAEHLYSTDDAQIDDDLTVGGTIGAGICIINQTADAQGIQINGFDDESDDNLKLFVDSSGRSVIKNEHGHLWIESDDNIYLRPDNVYVGWFSSVQFGFYNDKDFQFGQGGSEHATLRWGTAQTVNALIMGLDSHDAGASRTLIVCDDADRTFNFEHAAQTNPTVYVHSANQSVTEWISIFHDQTDGVITTGAGDIQLLPATGFVGIGKAPTVALDVVGDIKATGFLELTQKAGTTTDGDLWNDNTQEALQTFVSGIEQTLVGVIFTQTADQTIANTTTETTFFGTGVGTLTLPANFWVIGKTIRVKIHGDMADTGNPTAEVQAYYGATSLIDSGAITLSGLAGTEEWECEVIITCRSIGATGTVQTVIDWEYETTTGSSAIERLDVAGVLQTIDTTAPGVLDVTFQWGTAAVANTIHSHVAFVEVLN